MHAIALWLTLVLSPASLAAIVPSDGGATAESCPDLSGRYARPADDFGSTTELLARQVGCEQLELRYEFPAEGAVTSLTMVLDGQLRIVADDEFTRTQESYRWEGTRVLQELVLTLKYDDGREVRIETRYGLGEDGAFVESGRDLDSDGNPGDEYEWRYGRVGE